MTKGALSARRLPYLLACSQVTPVTWWERNELEAGEKAVSGSRSLPRACPWSTLALGFSAFRSWGCLAQPLSSGRWPGRPAPL